MTPQDIKINKLRDGLYQVDDGQKKTLSTQPRESALASLYLNNKHRYHYTEVVRHFGEAIEAKIRLANKKNSNLYIVK